MKKDNKYLISNNELLGFLRYELLYKWKNWQARAITQDTFGDYLLNNTNFQPNHEFIQSLCRTEEERKDPIKAGIYNDILPADIARYQLKTLYKPFNEK